MMSARPIVRKSFQMSSGAIKEAPLFFQPNTVLRGAASGLAATLIMDLLLVGAFATAGWPAFTCFSIVGDTVAQLFVMAKINIAGGILPGVAAHYLIGPLYGILFGILVARVKIFRTFPLLRALACAVLYVEVASLPLLMVPPVLLKMSPQVALLWTGGSLVMHLIWGAILGMGMFRLTSHPSMA